MNVTIMNYKILQTLLALLFLLQTAGSVPELSLDEAVGGGSIRGSGLSQTNSMSFFTTFSIYIENSRLGGGPLIPAGCTLVQYAFINYKITIPHCTNYLGYIRTQQLVNNVQSMVRKKKKRNSI